MNLLSNMLVLAYRVLALLAWAALLVFPAYKGVWSGYVPVIAGGVAAWLVQCRLNPGTMVDLRLPQRWFLPLVLVGPALIQTGLLLWLRPEPLFDGRFVFEEARTLLASGRMSEMTYYPPAQTWWYAAFMRLFGDSALVAQLSHLPLGAAVTLATYALARRVLPFDRARWVTAAVAFYPSYLGYVLVTPYYHYLYTALTVLLGVLLLRSAETSGGSALLAGACAGAGALAKATQLIAPAQALLFWLLAPPAPGGRSRVAVRFALFLAGMAVVLAPWVGRNVRVFGEPVWVCTSGGLVLYSANNPESNGLYSSLPDEVKLDDPRAMLAHSRACSARARAFILEHPGSFVRLAAAKFLHTWGNESTFTDLINRRGRSVPQVERMLSAIFLAGWSAVVWLWAAGAWRAIRFRASPPTVEILAACLVLPNVLVYLLFEGGDRHHLPFIPLILVSAVALAGPARRLAACDPSPARL